MPENISASVGIPELSQFGLIHGSRFIIIYIRVKDRNIRQITVISHKRSGKCRLTVRHRSQSQESFHIDSVRKVILQILFSFFRKLNADRNRCTSAR